MTCIYIYMSIYTDSCWFFVSPPGEQLFEGPLYYRVGYPNHVHVHPINIQANIHDIKRRYGIVYVINYLSLLLRTCHYCCVFPFRLLGNDAAVILQIITNIVGPHQKTIRIRLRGMGSGYKEGGYLWYTNYA